MGTGGRGAIQVGVTHSHELDSTRGGSVERSGFQRCKELDVRGPGGLSPWGCKESDMT